MPHVYHMAKSFEPTSKIMQSSEMPNFEYQQSKAPPNPSSLNPSDSWLTQAPMLKGSTSQPTTMTQLYVADSQSSYASVLKARLANMKHTKATQTDKNDSISTEELEWFGLPPTISNSPVFPIDNYFPWSEITTVWQQLK